MNSDPTPSQPTASFLLVIHELVAVEMDLVRLVQHQAHAEVEAAAKLSEPSPDFTVPAERMSRSVRRSIMLGLKAEKQAAALANAGQHRTAARKQVIRAVEDAIGRDAPDDVERLETEFLERLDTPDFEDDIGGRPAADIIAEICHDLGLAARSGFQIWKRRTPADVALLCTRAATKRPATGPFVLPMPPRDWVYDKTLFNPVEKPAHRQSATGCRDP